MNLTDFSGQRPGNLIEYAIPSRPVEGRTLSSLELLRLASAANTSREATERNNLLVLLHVRKILVRLGQFEVCRTTIRTIVRIDVITHS